MALAASEPLPGRMRQLWQDRSLLQQFALAGGVVLVIAMVACGMTVTGFVRSNVLNQRAAATALFIDSVVTPQLQELDEQRTVSPARRAVLDALIGENEFGARIPFLEVWLPDGTVAYSNSDEIIGRQFELPAPARSAFAGQVVAGQTDLSAQEHVARQFASSFTEIYSPVRKQGNDTIIAVVEIHESVELINGTLTDVTVRSWLAVGLSCLAVGASLLWIVRAGSNTIGRQKLALARRLRETQALAQRYHAMKQQAQAASRTVTELNDRLMRSVGADLHDGPAQLISFATLKVERARRAANKPAREQELGDIEVNLMRALDEIRTIAKGLVLPAIEALDLAAVIEQAISAHVQRTGMEVGRHNSLGKLDVASAVNVCAYRFVQEGLNNAFRHAHPAGTRVLAGIGDDATLHIEIISQPADVPRSKGPAEHSGIGLKGLKARVESLGGDFDFTTGSTGARLSMMLDLKEYLVHG